MMRLPGRALPRCAFPLAPWESYTSGGRTLAQGRLDDQQGDEQAREDERARQHGDVAPACKLRHVEGYEERDEEERHGVVAHHPGAVLRILATANGGVGQRARPP